MLLGNKTDKEAEREVQKEVGERLAKVLILNNYYKYYIFIWGQNQGYTWKCILSALLPFI